MRTRTSTRAAILGLTACLVIWQLAPLTRSEVIELASGVEIFGGSAVQARLVRWAIDRFEGPGLLIPPVAIHFHTDLRDCDGYLGYTARGRIDVCSMAVDDRTHHTVLHEMAHAWLDANTTQTLRDRFLELRGLRSWNETRDPWELRGYEQAAELMAWVLGERIITPKIPDNDPALLAVAFEFLTGIEPTVEDDIAYPGGSKGVVRSGLPDRAPDGVSATRHLQRTYGGAHRSRGPSSA